MRVVVVKVFVAPFENVELGEGQVWVVIRVDDSIQASYMQRPINGCVKERSYAE